MKPYQEEYLELLRSVERGVGIGTASLTPEEFVEAAKEAAAISKRSVERGTRLLREELFPVLDDILSASGEEIDDLQEFAGKLMSMQAQSDVGLHYRIHLALMDYARHRNMRDMLIKELYLVGMSLYNMETMLSPNIIRLYSTRMRMCFTEAASYFDTEYADIKDPETRGYIHRSMGNIALSYETGGSEVAEAKLAAISRSISILSDPDIQAMTPELPWGTYLYKSHQERTSLLGYLRSGNAGPEAFAQVLESAQIVQSRQLQAARDSGRPLEPRWQYAYMAARYHCGAMLLPELLDGIYGLSSAMEDDDFGGQSMFSHVSAPALYMEYSKHLKDDKLMGEVALRERRMTARMLAWLTKAPNSEQNEQLMFYLRQFLYAYRELPGCMPFFEVLQNVFALRHPFGYIRMWIAGQIARQLTDWAVEDCPEALAGLPGFGSIQQVIWGREEILDMAFKAGKLYDTGMVHFFNLESSACRGLFEEEEALLRLHPYCGSQLLSMHPSTKIYADIALGHHRYFNDKGGYPVDFSMQSSPMRPMTAIVAAADALAACSEDTASRYRPSRSFEDAMEALKKGEGSRYAPFVVKLMRCEARRETLREKLDSWRIEACLDMYKRRSLE